MARIRSIKPEFWTSEQVMELTPLARLTFIGLWNFCDDRGVHPASAKTLKALLFASDDMTADAVAGLVAEIMQQGLVVEFEVEGRLFWHVTGWSKHQKIDKPTYRYPAPPTSQTNTRAFAEASPNPPRTLAEASTTERSRAESSRVEKESSGNNMPASEESTSPQSPPDGQGQSTPAAPPADQTREQAIAVWLRKAEKERGKFLSATSSDTRIQTWAERSITDAQLAEAYELAVADRTKNGDASPINPGFLDVFITKVLVPSVGTSAISRLPVTHELAWALAWSGIENKGAELGIHQAEGEQPPAYKARVYAAAGVTQLQVDKLRADLPTPQHRAA